MLLKGDGVIPPPRQPAWAFLAYPNQRGQGAPGVERIGGIEPRDRHRSLVSFRLGELKSRTRRVCSPSNHA